MPLYEYECEKCAQRFERIQKFSDPPIESCPSCNGPVRKLFSSPAIQFKGSGFYITDYARKSGGDSAKPASGGDAKAKTETSTESKTDKTDSRDTKSSTTKTE
jgi:putative FmdB family regulatory protein